MTTPAMPFDVTVSGAETEAQRQARIRRNLARLKELGAPPEDVQAYVESERVTPEMEAARTPLTRGEKVAGGIRAAYQGASFNFGDEIMGTTRGLIEPDLSVGEAIADERAQQAAFRDAHPKTALGLELGGGLVTGLGAAKALAGGPSLAKTVLLTGAGSGALAGAGAGEGLVDRGVRAGAGGLLGFLMGAAAPKILTTQAGLAGPGGQVADDAVAALATQFGTSGARAASSRVPTGRAATPAAVPPTSPTGYGEPALRAAQRAIGDVPKARGLLEQLEQQGMGDEALAMNVGADQTVRAVRAAANQPGSQAGQIVGERLARQGGALGEAVPQDIGTVTKMGGTPGPVRLSEMQRELGKRVEDAFDVFRAHGELIPAVRGGVQPKPMERLNAVMGNRQVSEAFMPYVERVRTHDIALEKLTPSNTRVLDEAFKLLQKQIRAVRASDPSGARGLQNLRDRVLDALERVDPDYGTVVRQYALDEDVGKVVQEGFETGLGLPGKPVGTATVALGETTPAAQQAMRAGHVTALQQRAGERASNVDLDDLAQFRDVARAVVGTKAAREQFIELHGRETYEQLKDRLMPKIRAAAQNAAARGNSTTTKQLLDALAFGDDAAMDALGALATGSPRGAAMGFLGKRVLGPAERAYRLGVGRTAGETADLLTTKGAPNIRGLLDILEAYGKEEAARRAAQQQALAPVVSGVQRPLAERAP